MRYSPTHFLVPVPLEEPKSNIFRLSGCAAIVVMEAVAILRTYPGTRDALDALLLDDDVAVWDTLLMLTERHLLHAGNEDSTDVYYQHAMVQAFYYEHTRQSKRRTMHQRAGEYYTLHGLKLAIQKVVVGRAVRAFQPAPRRTGMSTIHLSIFNPFAVYQHEATDTFLAAAHYHHAKEDELYEYTTVDFGL